MRSLLLLPALLLPVAAHANPVVFNLVGVTIGTGDGSFDNGTFTGTVTLDTTTSTLVSSNFQYNDVSQTVSYNSGLAYSSYFGEILYSDFTDDLFFLLPQSLTGYTGSSICIQTSGCHYGPSEVEFSHNNFLYVTGGSLVQAATVTPEPSSLLLLGTGVAGVAGAMRRRFQKA